MSAPIAFGNYELVDRIAEGGMAEVWRARSLGVAGFEKIVVIKRVLPSLLERPGFAELLVREAKIAARLSHPNIIQIYDLGEQEGSYFIAMELLRGRDLAAALSHRAQGEPALDLGLRLWIAAEVAKALDYAHRARFDDGKPMCIVHRDVSPQNVLLGFEGEVKVADFGIARADEPGLGRGEDPKILRGKYAYMSPEQGRGESLDNRSDIFSFGILLYELATRRRMFRGMSSAEMLEMVRAGKLPSHQRHLPLDGLRPILARALAPTKAERFASAAEIHEQLLTLIFGLGRPVSAIDLAAAMHRMFPAEDRQDPNKLRVDLMVRAYDDAASASDPGRTEATGQTLRATAQTHALPTSRRARAELRRLAFLVVEARPGEETIFAEAAGLAGGEVLSVMGGLRVAAFGLAGVERAVGHAVRGALELRRSSRLRGPARVHRVPPMAVLAGQGRLLEGVVLEPDAEVLERALVLIGRAGDGDIQIDPTLEVELAREFRLETRDGATRVDGFRSRRDRDAGALRERAPLVGRRATLRELSSCLIEAAHTAGVVVHLVGAPGVGKSRLFAELRGSAAPHDFVFVHGRADEADTERSFGALGDLVMDICGIEAEDAPAQCFEKVERLRVLGLRPREVRRLGELIGLAYPVPTDERVGRPRGIEVALSIRKAIFALSRDRVVVLALEDLQWMDDATRQVLPLLIEGLARARVVVLVTRRPGSTGPLPFGRRTIELEPLDAEGTGRLLAHHLGARAVDPELAAHAHRITGGTPAWIELLAEPMAEVTTIEEGVARRISVLPTVEVPSVVRTVVTARIAHLRARERSMLRVAAALGGEIDVSLLSSIEGLVGNTERPILRRLWARRLLLDVDSTSASPEQPGAWGGDEEDGRLPRSVRLPSEFLRHALLAELGASELERLHSRIVATLERTGAHETLPGLEKLAWHAARSVDPRRAPDYYARASEVALEQGDRPRGASHLLAAARLVREISGDPGDRRAFELGLDAADTALDAGSIELAGEALTEVDIGVSRADAPGRVRRAIARARHARQRLDDEAAVRALTEVEDLLDEVDDALRDRARILLARTCVEGGATPRGLAVLDSIITFATGARLGAALALRGTALARIDELEASEDAVNDALALAARLGDPHVRYAALAALAVLVEARGDMGGAASRYREAAEVAADVAEPDELAGLLCRAAVTALAAGDIEGATQRADEAGRWAERSSVETWRLVVASLRAALAIREHPDASYVPGLVRSVERLEALGRPAESALAVEMLVHAHLALGDPGAAARTLQRAADHARRAGHQSYARRLHERRAALGPP